jgi:thiol-disulfide isomerase/thioredoxin
MNRFFAVMLILASLTGCGDNGKKEVKSTQDIPSNEIPNITTAVTEPAEMKPYQEGDKIPLRSISGSNMVLLRTGNGFKLEDNDKTILFDVFATYCAPCRTEAPQLMNLQLKYSDDLVLIGLIYFENITDREVLENFSKRHNAYYFISNSKENERIVKQILLDVDFHREAALPFKVVLKDGNYQKLTNVLDNKTEGRKFYIGKTDPSIIEQDLSRIFK